MAISPVCNIRYGLCTNKGRREENEDSLMVQENSHMSSFMVADGAGGYNYGKDCSRVTVEAVKEELESVDEFSVEYVKLLVEKKYAQINNYFYNISLKHDVVMATTASMLNFVSNNYILSNIGDTKVFLLREGKLKLISEVHTVAQEEYENRKITYEQLLNHNKKHVLTKAIGAKYDIKPFIAADKVMDDDTFIICTDGIYNFVSEEYLREVFKPKNFEDQNDLNVLCHQVVQNSIKNGSKDNLSIIAIHIINT